MEISRIIELQRLIPYINQFLNISLVLHGTDADVIRKVYGKQITDDNGKIIEQITNDDGKFIDMNYCNILVTYDVEKKEVTNTFEIYTEDGNFAGTISVYDSEIKFDI